MNTTRKIISALLLGAAAVAATGCCGGDRRADTPVIRGKVADTAEFDRFIATRPMPEAFRAHYPDVVLVLPGEIASKELRTDRSRYFAELDGDGRITGGSFK